jgi:hypothetical protein
VKFWVDLDPTNDLYSDLGFFSHVLDTQEHTSLLYRVVCWLGIIWHVLRKIMEEVVNLSRLLCFD